VADDFPRFGTVIREEAMKHRETARYAILAGWLIALLGMVCYMIATRAREPVRK
jgi:hypothetical protein